MSEVSERKRNELLDDLSVFVARALADLGIGESMATAAGEVVADDVSAHWGGQNVCIPKDHHRRISERNRRIVKAFTGTNHSELAREHDLTVSMIYKIIKLAKTKRQAC
ncbi:Mor transcription activator family protein [Pseudomonas tohonis]|uniref:Mor transcription activator family protein n=1 Tax=Pseudomonas tohonis TaxID=2725477 RepID=UPI001F37929B|nr:Mor transcription activator family protein [Pseudomonas tohonis]